MATKDKTIAQMVIDDFRTATVFKEFQIDFCCGGKKTIKEACSEQGVDQKKLILALAKLDKTSSKKEDTDSMELDTLTDLIVKKHHSYVQKRIPEIEAFLSKVARVHGANHPEVKTILEIFLLVKEDFYAHMLKEETVLFPYIKELVTAKKNKKKLDSPHFGTIKNPINMMEQEHTAVGDAFKKIRKISNNLVPPENACNTYRVAYSMLDEFEDDLHRHVHLESNILFPKAIALESGIPMGKKTTACGCSHAH